VIDLVRVKFTQVRSGLSHMSTNLVQVSSLHISTNLQKT